MKKKPTNKTGHFESEPGVSKSPSLTFLGAETVSGLSVSGLSASERSISEPSASEPSASERSVSAP